MISIPKIVSVLSCGFLLCLGLSNAAQADNERSPSEVTKTDLQTDRTGVQENMIRGEVLRVEGENYFIKGKDSTEVRLHTDQTTQMIGEIKHGDRIEAKLNDQNHTLSMRSARGTDASHEKESGRDSLHETDAAHGNAAGRATDFILE